MADQPEQAPDAGDLETPLERTLRSTIDESIERTGTGHDRAAEAEGSGDTAAEPFADGGPLGQNYLLDDVGRHAMPPSGETLDFTRVRRAPAEEAMTPDTVANFETFPALPEGAPAPGAIAPDTVANFETFPPLPAGADEPSLVDTWEKHHDLWEIEQGRIERRIEELTSNGRDLEPGEIFDLDRIWDGHADRLLPILDQVPADDLLAYGEHLANTIAINRGTNENLDDLYQRMGAAETAYRARTGGPHPAEARRLAEAQAAQERDTRDYRGRTGPPDPETVARLEGMDFSGIMRAATGRPAVAAGGAVVAAGLVFAALLGRSGTPASPSAATASAGASVATGAPAAAASAAAASAWPGCSAAPVSASAAEAIPQDRRQLVGVYCLGGHYYPVEQFRTETQPACVLGATGQQSYFVTKSGGPAIAIDDAAATLANPRPQGCGFIAMSEQTAHAAAIAERLPEGLGRMYPVHADAYRAFQAKAGGTR